VQLLIWTKGIRCQKWEVSVGLQRNDSRWSTMWRWGGAWSMTVEEGTSAKERMPFVQYAG
jgi:hypothetical protein